MIVESASTRDRPTAIRTDTQQAAVRSALAKLKSDSAAARADLSTARREVTRLRAESGQAGRDEKTSLHARQRDLGQAQRSATADERTVHREYDAKIIADRQDVNRRDNDETTQEQIVDKAKLAADQAAFAAELRRTKLKGESEIQAATREVTEKRADVAQALAEHAKELRDAQRREQDALQRAQSIVQADTATLEARRRAYVASGGKPESVAVTPVQSL